MPTNPAGPFPLDGVDFETWLIKFDKKGTCISPQTRAALLARLDSLPSSSPIILFSHGWNNEFGDAKALYSAFLKHLQEHSRKYGASQLRPLFVGVIWPSTWFSFDTGPAMAGAVGDPAAAAFTNELADALSNAHDREHFDKLIEAPRLDHADAAVLSRLLAKALAAQDTADTADASDAEGRDGAALAAGISALQEIGRAQGGDDDVLAPGGTINRGAAATPRDAGLLNFLDPRVALRVASVYQMKDRAGTVGWNGVSALVRDVLAHSQAPLHLVGHSYGAKVILSALAAAQLPRPVDSALLLQPAVSHLSFAEQIPGRSGVGGYRPVLEKISRSLVMTYSAHDFPLHELFHRALQRDADLGDFRVAGTTTTTTAGQPPNRHAALGGYGPRGAGEQLVEPLPMPGTPVPLRAGSAPLAFDGTLEPRIGGHGDVATAATAWLLYAQMAR